MRNKRVLIANRGEIALRVIKACKQNDVQTVLVVSEADKDSLPARLADYVVCIGPPQVTMSYLDVSKIINAALESGADAIHPGYGFLAEKPELADACENHGITFIGPRSEIIRQMGDKIRARKIAKQCGVPVIEGTDGVSSFHEVDAKAQEIGFPILLKAAAGGGGRGMRIAWEQKDLKNAFDMASNEARQAFGDPTIFVERYVQNGRHVEVQILGDNFGKVIHLGERDCSSQRRYQKVIEEAPAPNLSNDFRERILEAALSIAQSISYNNAGTVEFLVDKDRNTFYFLEVNTRIQVEHPVTEMITGVDLVKEQLRIAFGYPLSLTQSEIQIKGHAIECRVTAESAKNDFMPSPGRISRYTAPLDRNIRIDSHCYEGYMISPYYDSLMAKVIAYGDNRDLALEKLKSALSNYLISGVETNIPFLKFLISQPEFIEGNVHVKWIESVVDKFRETVE